MSASASRRPGAIFGWLLCQALRRPWLLRTAAAILRRWPILCAPTGSVAGREAVVAAFRRTTSFSNTSHAPNLVAGEFVIGVQDGPRHQAERARLERLLLPAAELGGEAAVHAAALVREIKASPEQAFDLVEDYLAPATWRALKRCLGDAGDFITRGGGSCATAADAETLLFRQLRHVGSHLIVGEVADAAVQARAEAAGAALRRRVAPRAIPALRAARGDAFTSPRDHPEETENSVQRGAVGLMWVAHPATVQAGANALMELVARPALYNELRALVFQAGESAFKQASLHHALESTLLELLRFRPPFPLLVRDVPRDAWLETGDTRPAPVAAGRKLRLWVIGALFDERAVPRPDEFDPGRAWPEEADRWLVFGFGPRQCPASRHVMQILTSLMIGLLQFPRLQPDRSNGRSIVYDGPAVAHLRLRF